MVFDVPGGILPAGFAGKIRQYITYLMLSRRFSYSPLVLWYGNGFGANGRISFL